MNGLTSAALWPLALVSLLSAGRPLPDAQAPAAADALGRALPAKVADARPGEARLIVSNGLRIPLEAVKGQAQQAVGRQFVIEYGPSLGLQATIASGQPFEVAIVTPDVIEAMIAAGAVVKGSRFDVARVPVAIGQRGDGRKSDISTPAALKETLIKASSVRWTTNGASMPTINKMLDGLGIRRELEAKLNMPADHVRLGPGDYELTINLASEIVALDNVSSLGTIPTEFNVPAVMSAGIGAAGDRKAAAALIDFLRGPAIEPSLIANGMVR